ncbi:MAG: cyclic nucleotide-binding domain-containing protein [Anaerolineae bacterium]|nr:cyclic nucleotide-binding domain-containing protein [Anaerolineae bacterium]
MRVHDGERTLNTLSDRDVFGEMALVDPAPRVASVTAMEDTLLLRLSQDPFYEAVNSQAEIARGVIRVLSRHLRDRVQDVGRLDMDLRALQEKS